MDTISITHPAPPPTRELRGLKLHRERGHEIESIGKGRYEVPGCSGGSYRVDLAPFGGTESCNCPDFRRHHDTCKHLVAATVARAKARTRARTVQAERTAARASRGNVASLTSLS
jgi:uncharacterized Zn finger protein